jgi:MarR family transcriptional regulator, negative regulator of the multidrug operon emrRAB
MDRPVERGAPRSRDAHRSGPDSDRLENTLAALAFAINDGVIARLADRYGLGSSDAAALVVLSRIPQRIDDVSQQLRISHSAAVRLVDRLVASGFATRAPGRDARSVSVRLTPAGKRRARAVLAQRQRVVGGMLAGLSTSERSVLARTVERLLENLAVDWRTTMEICRLCDLPACEEHAPCPAAQGAERTRAEARGPLPRRKVQNRA